MVDISNGGKTSLLVPIEVEAFSDNGETMNVSCVFASDVSEARRAGGQPGEWSIGGILMNCKKLTGEFAP